MFVAALWDGDIVAAFSAVQVLRLVVVSTVTILRDLKWSCQSGKYCCLHWDGKAITYRTSTAAGRGTPRNVARLGVLVTDTTNVGVAVVDGIAGRGHWVRVLVAYAASCARPLVHYQPQVSKSQVTCVAMAAS